MPMYMNRPTMPPTSQPLVQLPQLHANYYTDLIERQNAKTHRSAGVNFDLQRPNHASRVPKIVPMVARPGSAEELSSL